MPGGTRFDLFGGDRDDRRCHVLSDGFERLTGFLEGSDVLRGRLRRRLCLCPADVREIEPGRENKP
jgi:hypothetical protein